jgi:glucokinase
MDVELLPSGRTPARETLQSGGASMSAPVTGLVGDIGGSEARFALLRTDGMMTRPRVYPLNDHPSLISAIDAYLADESPPARLTQAVLAVAAPVTGDQVALTNHPWTFSIKAVRRHFGLRRLRVINDLAAHAIAIPRLDGGDRIQIGSGSPVAEAPIGLIAPGTGLGMSALIPAPNGAIPVEGEGGHVTMPPADARESAVLDLMRRRYDHVSAERVVSGLGLVNLYNALCELAGAPAAPFTPAQITDPRTWNEDPCTRDATTMFCAMLGTVAGNLALTLGSRGGIYIAGGIVPKLGTSFAESGFRARFEAKGRFRGYLAAIPTYVIVRPLSALVGAAALLERVPDPR